MYNDIRETTIEHCDGDDWCSVSTAERKYITKAKALAEKFPDEVYLIENQDGSIYMRIPARWLKFPSPPKQISEENRAKAAERLREARKKKDAGKDDFDNNSM